MYAAGTCRLSNFFKCRVKRGILLWNDLCLKYVVKHDGNNMWLMTKKFIGEGYFDSLHLISLPSNLQYKRTKSQNLMFLVPSCCCFRLIHWSREWRWIWSSADRQCSNYIRAINNSLPTKVWLVLEVWRHIISHYIPWPPVAGCINTKQLRPLTDILLSYITGVW